MIKSTIKTWVFALGVSSLLIFQNCSGADFGGGADSTAQGPSSTTDDLDQGLPPVTDIVEGNDVMGGHFDLDTSTEIYDDGDGDTNKHVHEYDDKYQTNVANFFALEDRGFDNVGDTVASSETFYIVVANGDLSPRVALEINGTSHSVAVKQHGPFTLAAGTDVTQLTSLRAIVATDAIVNQGLVSTQTGCVVDNDFSADGRYRNGALTIQIVSASGITSIDPNMGVASAPGSLLWESTLFWHESGGDCR